MGTVSSAPGQKTDLPHCTQPHRPRRTKTLLVQNRPHLRISACGTARRYLPAPPERLKTTMTELSRSQRYSAGQGQRASGSLKNHPHIGGSDLSALIVPNESGSEPLNWLHCKSSTSVALSEAYDAGIVPGKLLLPKPMVRMFRQDSAIKSGSDPSTALLERKILCKLVHRANDSGILPHSLLLFAEKFTKLVQLPYEDGRLPLSWLVDM